MMSGWSGERRLHRVRIEQKQPRARDPTKSVSAAFRRGCQARRKREEGGKGWGVGVDVLEAEASTKMRTGHHEPGPPRRSAACTLVSGIWCCPWPRARRAQAARMRGWRLLRALCRLLLPRHQRRHYLMRRAIGRGGLRPHHGALAPLRIDGRVQ